MTRKQLERLVKFLDNTTEQLVEYDHYATSLDLIPLPESVWNNLSSAIAVLENELTFQEEYEPLDFQKNYHEEYEDLCETAAKDNDE